MSITREQFNEQIKPLKATFDQKRAELDALRAEFSDLASQIVNPNRHPDDDESIVYNSPEYQEADKKFWDENYKIESVLEDLAYETKSSWTGSFREGEIEFWEASVC